MCENDDSSSASSFVYVNSVGDNGDDLVEQDFHETKPPENQTFDDSERLFIINLNDEFSKVDLVCSDDRESSEVQVQDQLKKDDKNGVQPSSKKELLPSSASSSQGVTIVPGPPTGFCQGLPGITEPHIYLEAEGTYFCAKCGASYCYTCGYFPSLLTTAKKKKGYHAADPLCFLCYKTCSIIDGGNDEVREVKDMRNKLKKLNVPTTNDTYHHEVEELYDFYMSMKHCQHERITKNAEYPLFTSRFFKDIQEHVFYKGPIFSPGGFINDTVSIPDSVVPLIIELMAGFVKPERYSNSPYSASVSGIVINFANKSRAVNGLSHKIIKSSIRHAVDPRFPSFMDKTFCLFHHQCTRGDSVGIVLENSVPAPMKEMLYNSKIAFTIHNLLACDCECLASGKDTGDDQITCIHNLPLIVSIGMLLYRGLAKNFLHDVSTRWNGDLESSLVGSTRYDDCRDDILTMMEASSEDPVVIMRAATAPRIIDMLKIYKETTARYKPAFTVPPLRHELIRLQDFPVESAVTQKNRLEKEELSTGMASNDKNKKKTQGAAPNNENKNGSPPSHTTLPCESLNKSTQENNEDERCDDEIPPLEKRFGNESMCVTSWTLW